MRHSKALTVAGSVRTNTFGVRQAVVVLAVGIGLVWGGVAFAQEAYISHRLSQQVSDLRRQNTEFQKAGGDRQAPEEEAQAEGAGPTAGAVTSAARCRSSGGRARDS